MIGRIGKANITHHWRMLRMSCAAAAAAAATAFFAHMGAGSGLVVCRNIDISNIPTLFLST